MRLLISGLLLMLAVPAVLAAPQLQDTADTQGYALQDVPPATAPPGPEGGNGVADVEYVIEADDDGGDYGWEALKGTVDIPLDDMQWSLDQLPPSMRKALRLVLFDNYKVNFT